MPNRRQFLRLMSGASLPAVAPGLAAYHPGPSQPSKVKDLIIYQHDLFYCAFPLGVCWLTASCWLLSAVRPIAGRLVKKATVTPIPTVISRRCDPKTMHAPGRLTRVDLCPSLRRLAGSVHG